MVKKVMVPQVRKIVVDHLLKKEGLQNENIVRTEGKARGRRGTPEVPGERVPADARPPRPAALGTRAKETSDGTEKNKPLSAPEERKRKLIKV